MTIVLKMFFCFYLKLQQEKNKIIFKKAEQYVMEYRKQEDDELRIKRTARKAGNFYVPAEAKLAFVIRIRGYALNNISVKYSNVSKH